MNTIQKLELNKEDSALFEVVDKNRTGLNAVRVREGGRIEATNGRLLVRKIKSHSYDAIPESSSIGRDGLIPCHDYPERMVDQVFRDAYGGGDKSVELSLEVAQLEKLVKCLKKSKEKFIQLRVREGRKPVVFQGNSGKIHGLLMICNKHEVDWSKIPF